MVIWLCERHSKSLEKLGKLADKYTLARNNGRGSTPAGKSSKAKPEYVNFPLRNSRNGNKTQNSDSERRQMIGQRTHTNFRGDKKCYNCGQWGHLCYTCPRPTTELRALLSSQNISKYFKVGTVNGKPVKILVDTGCDHTIVSAKYVRQQKLEAGDKIPVLCIHGDICFYPTAKVQLVWEDTARQANAVVTADLSIDVLLGRERPV